MKNARLELLSAFRAIRCRTTVICSVFVCQATILPHLRLFSLRLETSPNVSINCNATLADCMSSMKIVVSSAYWLSKIILSLTVMPFISLFFLKAFASNSTARTNNEPDKGSPCLTPLLNGKYSEVWPLFIMQLFALVENH